jgi:hypothetical protein
MSMEKNNLGDINADYINEQLEGYTARECHMTIIFKNSTEALTVINTSDKRSPVYLFSRKVFAFDTFFPIADAFQEK